MQQTVLGGKQMFLYEFPCCHAISFFLQTLVLLLSLPFRHIFCITFSDAVTLRFSARRCCTLYQEIHELKDQIQDVEIKYTQNLKEAKVWAWDPHKLQTHY